jgi:cytoskeletal protein CcmA (bactofilin family)
MKVIVDKIDGNLLVNEDTQLNGMVIGNVSVEENKTLQLNGMVFGEIVIKPTATVYLNGIVNGRVINGGGHLEIFGIVNGAVVKQKGETIISPEARISRIE